MRLEIHAETDAAYLYVAEAIAPGEVVHSREVEELLADYDAQGRLLGVEFLWWSGFLRLYRGLVLPPALVAQLSAEQQVDLERLQAEVRASLSPLSRLRSPS